MTLDDFTPHARALSYVTRDTPGIGGRLKQRPEDFLVEEIPAYQPCGEGEHIYLFVEKRGLSSTHMVRILAEHFGVRRDAVGIAGLKDKHAITRQVVSIHTPGRTHKDFPEIRHPAISVHWADQHANKLRRGHLLGNRFVVRVRDTPATAVLRANAVLKSLARLGVPNRAGEQRFGVRGRNHLIGRALILGDDQRVLDELLGPSAHEELDRPNGAEEARLLYAQGRYEEAMHATPRSLHTERRVLSALARGLSRAKAVRAIERLERSFYFSSFQSAIFNTLLDERLISGSFTGLVEGDLAFKHGNGAVFAVDAAVAADPGTAERVSRLEISPSGPMWGDGMTRAAGEVGRREQEALLATGVTPDDLARFADGERDAQPGSRRAYRAPLTFVGCEGGRDEHGEYVKCVFELPRGAFATVAMDEVMKPTAPPDQPDAGEPDDGEECS